MGRLLKVLLVLILLAGIAFVGFAYLGDLSPERAPVIEPVELDGQ